MKSILLTAVSFFLLFTAPLSATEIRKERVQFKPGETGATINGKIKGDQIVDYLLRVRAGQKLVVSLETKNTSTYFNVLPPGEDTAIFIGSTSGNRFEGNATKDGDYTVRVYLMRNAARRGATASYTIRFAVTGDSQRP